MGVGWIEAVRERDLVQEETKRGEKRTNFITWRMVVFDDFIFKNTFIFK